MKDIPDLQCPKIQECAEPEECNELATTRMFKHDKILKADTLMVLLNYWSLR